MTIWRLNDLIMKLKITFLFIEFQDSDKKQSSFKPRYACKYLLKNNLHIF
jgi:hypothetical protein